MIFLIDKTVGKFWQYNIWNWKIISSDDCKKIKNKVMQNCMYIMITLASKMHNKKTKKLCIIVVAMIL